MVLSEGMRQRPRLHLCGYVCVCACADMCVLVLCIEYGRPHVSVCTRCGFLSGFDAVALSHGPVLDGIQLPLLACVCARKLKSCALFTLEHALMRLHTYARACACLPGAGAARVLRPPGGRGGADLVP